MRPKTSLLRASPWSERGTSWAGSKSPLAGRTCFPAKPIAEVTDAELARVTAANFSVPFAMAHAAAGALAESGSGRLILVSHVLGNEG